MKEIVRYGYVSLASLISLRCPECEFDTLKDNNLEDHISLRYGYEYLAS